MKIEIHIRDRAANGDRVGFKNLFLESCRVYKEPGDSLRLDNLAVAAAVSFGDKAKDFVSKARCVLKTTKQPDCTRASNTDEGTDGCARDSANHTRTETER